VLISAGSGLFCGGTQRTALLIRQSTAAIRRRAGLIDALGKAVFQQGGI
jgi:hypothetical protein